MFLATFFLKSLQNLTFPAYRFVLKSTVSLRMFFVHSITKKKKLIENFFNFSGNLIIKGGGRRQTLDNRLVRC